jgi:uncharacterized protein (DUF2267 family)
MGRVREETLEAAYQQADEWRYERFLATVEQLSDRPYGAAEPAARATLQTLGELLSSQQARELAAELPEPPRGWLLDVEQHHQDLAVTDFIARVAAREGSDQASAEKDAEAVLAALARVLRGHELEHLTRHLPEEYTRLVREAEREHRDSGARAVVVGDVFLERVARRAALEPAEARRAAEAVLETLAERLAGGAVDDLADELPQDLHPALERGESRTGGKAQRLSLDEFVRRVAEREGGGYDEALERARAVFAALRDSLTDKRLSDVLAELPRAYTETLL